MMDNFLTTDTFRKGVSRYLKHFQYSIAEQDDLWRFLTEAAREDKTLDEDLTVKEIMDSWTLKMGYPVVTVSRDEETGETTLTQERFLLSEDNETEADGIDYKWHIPVSYVVQSNADFSATQPRLWIRQNEKSKNIGVISEKSEWVILNVQQTGYYRVNYDSRTWELLEKQLLEDHTKIHRVNRAQILDDAFNLAKAGILNYSVPLGLIRYLSKEKSNSPWVAAIRNLGYIDTMLRKTPAYEHYRRFIRSLVDPHMSEVRFERIEQVTGEYDDISKVSWNLNLLSLACQMGHEQCLKSASREFEFFMAKYNESEPDEPLLSPNTKSIVFCNGIKKGGETAFNFAYAHMLRTNIPQERSMLLSKLACTEESWLLSKYLGMLFDNTSGIRLQDFSHVFSAVAYNDVGIYLAFDMLVNKFDEIKQRFMGNDFGLTSLIMPFGDHFNSKFYLDQMKSFERINRDNLGAASRETATTIAKISSNIQVVDAHYDFLAHWFKNAGSVLSTE
ncbi:unnamed protein product [Cyprideis torosa]|uniref:Aminopeptidase N n=1 Tax=Cyprideis torosa TaxID=163714 RepID=A0A7R8WD06_9CRUS|nr:unnamed protein product [Cyprideis torosa]CAG0888889.1 unnamed protein product [Cyprideis torosa]